MAWATVFNGLPNDTQLGTIPGFMLHTDGLELSQRWVLTMR